MADRKMPRRAAKRTIDEDEEFIIDDQGEAESEESSNSNEDEEEVGARGGVPWTPMQDRVGNYSRMYNRGHGTHGQSFCRYKEGEGCHASCIISKQDCGGDTCIRQVEIDVERR